MKEDMMLDREDLSSGGRADDRFLKAASRRAPCIAMTVVCMLSRS